MTVQQVILLLSALILFSSCDGDSFSQIAEIDLPEHEPRIAVYSELGNNSPNTMSLFPSRSILSLDSSEPITDATVEITRQGENLIQSILLDMYELFYTVELNDDFLPGDVIDLKISHPDYETIEASQTIPAPGKIKELKFEEDGAIVEGGDRADLIELTFEDISDEENYYIISFFTEQYDSIYGPSGKFQNWVETLDANLIPTGAGYAISDQAFSGNSYVARFSNWSYYYGLDSVILSAELKSVSKDLYLFKISSDTYFNTEGNPFAEPVVIHENIENGYGLFGVGESQVDSITIIQ